jgi:hypothetical protein
MQDTRESSQTLQNRSFDEIYALNMVEPVLFDGVTHRREQSPLCAMKITEVGDTVYIAKAPVGTAQATAGWQVKRIQTVGADTAITWCDSNAAFDNVATDLTTLTYG